MKDRHLAGFLALFLGGIGVHKFYIGRTGQGFLYLLLCWTYIPLIFSIMDAIYYFRFKSNEEFTRKVCPAPENKAPRGNKLDDLKKLKELLDMKAISKAEFEAEKGKIIVNSQPVETPKAPIPQKTVNKLDKKSEVIYKKDKRSPFKDLIRVVLFALGIFFILFVLFTLSAVVYALFNNGSSSEGSSSDSPTKVEYGININNEKKIAGSSKDPLTIKDANHPSRPLCRQELAKRISNYSATKFEYEDVIYNSGQYIVQGYISLNNDNNFSLPVDKREKNRLQDSKCFSKDKSVCNLVFGTLFNCTMKTDEKGNITGPIALKFGLESQF